MARVEVPANEGVTLRQSTVGKIESPNTGESAPGGATQYFLGDDRLQDWERIGEIEEIIN
jgi:hypothetical protein